MVLYIGELAMNEIEHVSDWHSYYKLNGKRLTEGSEISIQIGTAILDVTLKVSDHEHIGRGGMDESYSWETISCTIPVHGIELVIDVEEGMLAKWR